MPPDAIETIAALVGKIKDGRQSPVDIMNLYRALQLLPPADASRVIEETTNGQYAVVPTHAPASWNARQRKVYDIFLAKAREAMLQPEEAPTHLATAPDA